MDSLEALLNWANTLGVELHGVVPQRIPERGTGVIATRSIEVICALE